MKRVLSGIAVALLITSQAAAAEPIATADPAPQLGAPAAVAPLGAPQAAELDAAPPPPTAPGCSAASAATDPDRRPHGEVWGGVGSHGYREAGGVVTAPVGKCGSVSVLVDRTEGGLGGRRH
jgi:hypothetical protein